ncbi:MAG: TonB-dependent receptor [Chitinophagaceae bacterium]|nr:MAG: TonB-dependent receptor [Chitinophagaceae bacterium]
MTKTKLLFFLFSLIFFTTNVSAQKGLFSGSLSDTSGKKPVVYATITIFHAKDTSIVTYRLSDESGKFKVPALPLQTELRAVITASGFAVWRKEFTLTEQSPQLDLGQVKMDIDVKEMEELLVISERPPVVVRKDTIEFNASAFKTLPTALVEDLLKKFPGVDVDKEGNITVNGRKVNKMLVEGKEFFGSDPKIASKNLPANLIDKVQVVDDKEELQRNPDLTAGEVGQVINLKLKKSIKQGWFGKLYAGAGTDDRYEGGGIVNLFRDTLQVSLLGYSNNLNRSGFSIQDVMNIGGFGRSNVNTMMVSSEGGFALNDVSFGGLGQGIQRSSGAGVNANTLLGKKTTLSLQYFFGQNKTTIGQKNNTQQFFNDTTLTLRSISSGEILNNSHRVSAYLKIKLDSVSTLEYRPSFAFTNTKNNNLLQSNSFSNYEPQLNESENALRKATNGFSTGHELSYNRQFKKPGRTFYFTLGLQYNSTDDEQYNDAENIFYKIPSTTSLHQLRDQDQHSLNTRFYANFTEPLSKSWNLRITQNVEYFANKDYIDTYEPDPNTGEYITPAPDLTNGLKRTGWRNSTYAGFRYKYKKFSITPGMTLRNLRIDNRLRKNPSIDQQFDYLLPALAITLDKWNFNYSVGAREPEVTDLQPVVNNTNPLYLQLGNPSLKPAVSHNISVNSYFFDVKRTLNYNFNANLSITDNGVVRARTVDPDGVQITQPINADGIWTAYSSISIRKQYKFGKEWKFSTGAGLFAMYSQGLVIVNQNRSRSRNLSLSPNVNASFNWNDKIEFNQRYAPYNNRSSYQSNAYPSLKVWRHTTNSELVVRLPKHIVWETSLDYNYNPQVAQGIQKSAFRWNAAVNLLFLKQDKGQLKLSVYDLLNQNISVSRTVRENYIQDTETIILRRYFLLTFTYNIRNFGGKVGGKDRLLMF